MKPNTKAFCLLLGIGVLAFALAIFVHQRNEMELLQATNAESASTSTVGPSEVTSTTPVVTTSTASVPVTTTTTTSATSSVQTKIFFSDERVNQASLIGFPELANPFHAYGTGTAFESALSWRVRDAKRHLLGEGSIHVNQPDAGIPGPFDFVGQLNVTPTTASGTLLIFEFSAKDGTPIHIVTIPVLFASSTRPL